MPNKASAKKALRQDEKRAQRNKIAKAEIHSARVRLRKLIDAKQLAEAETVAKQLGKMLDKAEARGIMKQGTVARSKSRLMRKLNDAKSTSK